MNEEASLDEILSGEVPSEPVAETPEVEAVAETEDAPQESEGEKQVEAEAETPDEPPASEPERPPEGFVPQTALLDERSKRQELQRQIDELNGRFTQLNQPTEPEKVEEPVDFLDDPDKLANNLEAKYEQRLQEIQYQNSLQRLQDFERIAKESHPDYDEAIQFFAQAAEGNPALQMEAAQASNPAEYAYRAGKRLAQINAAGGDFDAYVQQQREAAVAEYLQKNPTPASRAADVPESLSTVTGATQRTDKEPVSTPLESMFNNF